MDDDGKQRVKGRFADVTLTRRIPHSCMHDCDGYSERSYFGRLVNVLHPYSVLRILAENAENLDAKVTWQYGPLVQNGWARESEFTPGARRRQTFLVATEGSSDTHILKHAFILLRPKIADFSSFIDVSERHPFPGTGNLFKFAEGLAKIDVHNQTVFLFDNDAQGFETYQRLSCLSLPPNMRAIMLPELQQFRAFPARGPEGAETADINRRAAAIECYLDLKAKELPPAEVVWTSYKRELRTYQGVLDHKEVYTKAFLKQTRESKTTGAYDFSKIIAVLDALVSECCSIATCVWATDG
jgi:hypothetical protein